MVDKVKTRPTPPAPNKGIGKMLHLLKFRPAKDISNEEWLARIYHHHVHPNVGDDLKSRFPPHMEPFLEKMPEGRELPDQFCDDLVAHMNKNYLYDQKWRDRIFR
jgi:hypothetical protein